MKIYLVWVQYLLDIVFNVNNTENDTLNRSVYVYTCVVCECICVYMCGV